MFWLACGANYHTASTWLLLFPHLPHPKVSPDLSARIFFSTKLLHTKLLADAVQQSASAISGRVDPGGDLSNHLCRLLPALETSRSPVRKVDIERTTARLGTPCSRLLRVVKGDPRLPQPVELASCQPISSRPDRLKAQEVIHRPQALRC